MSSYSLHHFYCEAVDKKGHTRQVRVHPDSHGHIAALLSNPALPYRTFDDFVRDAVVHRLAWLDEHSDDDDLKVESQRLVAQAKLDRRTRIIGAERSLVDSLRVAVNTPEQRIFLTREQIDETLDSITTPGLRDEAERIVSGISLA